MTQPETGKGPDRFLRETLGDDGHAAALLSGDAWRRLCTAIEGLERRVTGPGVPDDPRHRAEGYRYLCRFLAAGLRSCVTHDDPDYPVLQRMIEYSTPWGLDHPDCLYLYAPLRGGESYRLFGNRGNADVFDVQVNSGHFSAARVEAVETVSYVDIAPVACGQDEVDVPIGPGTAGSGGLRTGDAARFLQIRQYFGDWENARPADLLIERCGARWPMPSPAPALIGRQLETLERWIEDGAAKWETLSARFLAMPENSVFVHEPIGEQAQGALSGQTYAMGHFRCDPGDAVIVRFTTPPCDHWNISLSNVFWECIEYASRQSSLNRHQAVARPDGRIECVIAQRDPGHANWLDPGGNTRGTLALRFHRATAKPEVSLERIPLTGLDERTSDGRPRVDRERRAQILTRRRHAVLRRFRC